ncbi:unnamed protein product [Umbelopsis ramanniana]
MLKLTFGAILKTRLPTTATVSESRVIQPLAMQWYSEKAFQPNITFEELQERIQAGKPDSFTLIDVREPGELREGIIPTATNVPLVRDVATLLKFSAVNVFLHYIPMCSTTASHANP